uniref:Uncharacterized protein n=1 Tax=Acrobeloides nanus TaxID=290746 RepID=A0A914E6Z9_9BILA
MQILQPPSVFFSISGDIVPVWTNGLFHFSSPSRLSCRLAMCPAHRSLRSRASWAASLNIVCLQISSDLTLSMSRTPRTLRSMARCLEILCVGVSECPRLTSVVESRKNGGVEQVDSGLWILNFFEYVLEIFEAEPGSRSSSLKFAVDFVVGGDELA